MRWACDTTAFVLVAVDAAYSAADIAFAGAVTDIYVAINGVIHNGANAGDFKFQWAQGTSNGGATTVLAGSYIEHRSL